jgi:hypothetical protein
LKNASKGDLKFNKCNLCRWRKEEVRGQISTLSTQSGAKIFFLRSSLLRTWIRYIPDPNIQQFREIWRRGERGGEGGREGGDKTWIQIKQNNNNVHSHWKISEFTF